MTDAKYNSFGEFYADYTGVEIVEWEDYRLDPEVKRVWIEALRSGKYKQAQEALRTSSDEFCCLGVLGDLFVKGVLPRPEDLITIEWQDLHFGRGYDLVVQVPHSYDSDAAVLPKKFTPFIGFDQEGKLGRLLTPPCRAEDDNWVRLASLDQTEVSLASLNDSDFTFEQIADVIEYAL